MRVKIGRYGVVPLALLNDGPPGSAVKLYAALSCFQGVEDHCWPSVEKLQEASGLSSNDTYHTAISWLRDNGWVVTQRRGLGKTNIYQVLHDADKPETGWSDKPETGESLYITKRPSENTNKESRSRAPVGAVQEAPTLSRMKDEIANHYQNRLTAVHPVSTWADVAKERRQLNNLAKKTRALGMDTSYATDFDLANAIVNQFMALRRQGNSDYWKNAPFTPSALATRWSEVVTALAAQAEREQAWREA